MHRYREMHRRKGGSLQKSSSECFSLPQRNGKMVSDNVVEKMIVLRGEKKSCRGCCCLEPRRIYWKKSKDKQHMCAFLQRCHCVGAAEWVEGWIQPGIYFCPGE